MRMSLCELTAASSLTNIEQMENSDGHILVPVVAADGAQNQPGLLQYYVGFLGQRSESSLILLRIHTRRGIGLQEFKHVIETARLSNEKRQSRLG
jgi:hypothetical protein